MAGFANARRLADAQDAGQYLYASFRKQPTIFTTTMWYDLSMSPGNPAPNYYIGSPGVFVPLKQSTDGGFRHGGNVASLGYKKFLRKLSIQTSLSTAAPTAFKLLDYVGFYGFIDESVTDEQFLDNTTPLPRHTNGAGLQLMPVVVAAQTGGLLFSVKYTNQDGVTDRVTPPVRMSTASVTGAILSSQAVNSTYDNNGPFLPLQAGDSGVRSVQSVTVESPGDVGLFALAIVKVLGSTGIFETTAASEKDFLTDGPSLPEITDDAYLNLICIPGGGTLNAAPIIGIMETTWG